MTPQQAQDTRKQLVARLREFESGGQYVDIENEGDFTMVLWLKRFRLVYLDTSYPDIDKKRGQRWVATTKIGDMVLKHPDIYIECGIEAFINLNWS